MADPFFTGQRDRFGLLGIRYAVPTISAYRRPVAVPIEAVGIEGRQIASLDVARAEYAKAPTWQLGGATPLPPDATIRIALSRNERTDHPLRVDW
jgi:hypothetical protein